MLRVLACTYVPYCLCPISIPLDTFPSELLPPRRGSCQLVTDLLRGNWCNGFGLYAAGHSLDNGTLTIKLSRVI